MSKVNNNVKKNGSKIKNKDNKGFTLVELLATLAVLSIIFTIVIYFALNIIGNSKGKSYKVTINNIERNAGNYVTENNDMLLWRDSSVLGYEYQCITVEHLIEKGYFDSDVLESNVTENEKVRKENYIYLERDKKTKTINKKILLYDGLGLSGLCTNMDTKGNISFEVKPIGKVVNGYSIGKDITIYYKLYNVGDSVNNYTYEYDYNNDDEDIIKGNFETISLQKKKDVKTNGTLNAWINNNADENIFNNSLDIKTIDSVGPIIKLKENNTEHQIVRKTVNIPIVVTDGESGVNADSFTEDDIKVTIGGVEITDIKLEKENGSDNEVNYNLTINDLLHKGEVIITIVKDKVYDNLDNINIDTVLKPKVSFTNEYTVSYIGNGNTGGSTSNTICTYGLNCKLGINGFIKTGYTFAGWNTKADGSGTPYTKGYEFKPYDKTSDLTLYAQWSANTYKIEYYTYDGKTKIGDSSHTYDTAKKIPTMSTLGGTAPSSSVTFYGWDISANSTTRKYTDGQSVNNLTTTANGTIKLYAIWRSSAVKITYYYGLNKASSGNSGNLYFYNAATSVPYTVPTLSNITNWTASGWRDDTTAGAKEYTANKAYDFSSSKTLYAVYSRSHSVTFYSGVNKATTTTKSGTAYYNSNASSTPTTVSITTPTAADCANISNWTELGWRDDTTAGVSETAFNTSITAKFGTAYTYYSVYNRTLTVSYNGNNNTGGSTGNTTKIVYLNSNSTTTSSQSVTLAANGFKKTGHTFSKWAANSASGTQYSAGSSYNPSVTYNASTFGKIMYAVWTVNSYNIRYEGNGNTGGSTANTSCTYGSNCTISSNGFIKTGYTFNGWNTQADGKGTAYSSGGTYNGDAALTLYAQWRINKVYIKYSVNGGTITSSAGGYKWTTDSSGIIHKNGAPEIYEIDYGGKLSDDGLANWSNSSYIKISKQEYTAVSDNEWKCLSGCTTSGKTYDHTVVYSAIDFCDASSSDCTVVVGVNWTPARVCYKVTADGGLNCRKSKSTSSSIVTGLSEGGYYMLKYSETTGGYKWYYSSSSSCYAAGHNGTKSWLSYYGTSCPSAPSTPSTPTPSTPTPSTPTPSTPTPSTPTPSKTCYTGYCECYPSKSTIGQVSVGCNSNRATRDQCIAYCNSNFQGGPARATCSSYTC